MCSLLDVEMLPIRIQVDEPSGPELLFLWAAAAAPIKTLTWGRVERDAEKILGFGEVGDESAADDQPDEAKDISDENEYEDDIEYVLPVLSSPRRVILGAERGVEGLVLWCLERMSRVVPKVNKWRVKGAEKEGAASQHGEGFCNARERGVELLGCENKLREEAGV